MTKLDWSRSGLHQGDPARVQRVTDFVEPDNMIVSVVPLSRAEINKMNALRKKRRQTAGARLAAANRAKPQAAAKTEQKRLRAANKEKVQRSPRPKTAHEVRKESARKNAAIEANEKAQKRSAERLVALKAKAARIAAIELERQEALRDRKTLNREWRAMLLKPE